MSNCVITGVNSETGQALADHLDAKEHKRQIRKSLERRFQSSLWNRLLWYIVWLSE